MSVPRLAVSRRSILAAKMQPKCGDVKKET